MTDKEGNTMVVLHGVAASSPPIIPGKQYSIDLEGRKVRGVVQDINGVYVLVVLEEGGGQ